MFVKCTCTFPSSPPPSDLSFPSLTLPSPAAAPPAPVCPLPLSFHLQMLSQAARLRSHQGVPSPQACATAGACADVRGVDGSSGGKQAVKVYLPSVSQINLNEIKIKQKGTRGPPLGQACRLSALNVRLVTAASLRPRSGRVSDSTHAAAAAM